jgi:selenium metabolism protein YedF
MTRTIDARGLSCPQPVILTKKVMGEKSGEEIITIVDNSAAMENISKLAASQGYEFTVETRGTESHIRMFRREMETDLDLAADRDLVILVKSQYFGQGDDELGGILMKSWAYTLTEIGDQIHSIIFMNGGIHLTTDGSPILEHLSFLQEHGVQLLSCGTCLDFFAKKDLLKVGQVTNMYTAMELLSSAVKSLVV